MGTKSGTNGGNVQERGLRATSLIRHRMTALDLTQAELARRLDRALPDVSVSQPMAYKWLSHPERLTPDRVWAMEDALELARGTLARVLGFGPVTEPAALPTLDEWLRLSAPELATEARAMIVGAYEAAVRVTRGIHRDRERGRRVT